MSTIIIAMSGKNRLHYNGRKFTTRGRPKVFADARRGEIKLAALIARYPVLNKYKLGVIRYVPAKSLRKNPHKAGSADKVAARELLLFAENDGTLYRMQFEPIARNLSKKFKAKKYSSTKAAKLWMYFADNAAKKYTFEHGDPGNARSWQQVKGYGSFSAGTRRLVARLLEKSWHAEMKAGNFHG